MLAPVEREAPLLVRRPLPGVTVARFAGMPPLMRAVPERFGTTLHLSGRSKWSSGREQGSSGPGTLGVKVPGEVTVERAREGALTFQAVLFDTRLVDEARTVLERSTVAPCTHVIDPRDPRAQPLLWLHRRLLDETAPAALEETVNDALYAFVELVCVPRGAEAARAAAFGPAVARARAMLDARIAETVGLDELATHARLDKFRLCRAFREEVGLPPHAYVTHRRVALAQELLSRGVSQAEVAARVGFYDQSLLHRHFKRVLGITPGEFVRARE
jgi:AraC-like DNA-binding protein